MAVATEADTVAAVTVGIGIADVEHFGSLEFCHRVVQSSTRSHFSLVTADGTGPIRLSIRKAVA